MCEGEVLPSIHQYHLSEQVSQNFTKKVKTYAHSLQKESQFFLTMNNNQLELSPFIPRE